MEGPKMYVSSNYFLAEFFSRLLIYFADVCAAQVFSIQILDILRSTRHSAAAWCLVLLLSCNYEEIYAGN